MNGILRKIESLLYAKAFRSSSTRRILAVQITTAAAASAAGVILLPFSLSPAAFAVGAVLITCNLWWLARGIEWSLRHGFSSGLALAGSFFFLIRLAIMALALYAALVPLALPVVPLLLGLSTVVASLAVRGMMRLPHDAAKEI